MITYTESTSAFYDHILECNARISCTSQGVDLYARKVQLP